MRELQEKFFHYILHPEESKEFANELIPVGTLEATEVMYVYHNDYHARLQEVMNENFTAIWKILGDELFFNVCRGYRDQYPSAFFDLGLYGDQFHHYLKGHLVNQEYPYLSELALLDYTFHQFFHAKVQPSLSAEELMSFQSDESIRFVFTENFAIFESEYPLLELWELPKNPEKSLDQVDWKPINFLLYKNVQSEIKSHELQPLQVELLDLMRIHPVQKALELVSTQMSPEQAPLISDLFQFILRENLVVSLEKEI